MKVALALGLLASAAPAAGEEQGVTDRVSYYQG